MALASAAHAAQRDDRNDAGVAISTSLSAHLMAEV
jgi:hypothetical protein